MGHGCAPLTPRALAPTARAQEGVPLGTNLQLLSGATSDSEENARNNLRSAPKPQRFDRLRDEHL